MLETKLIQYLSRFSKSELSEFRDFVYSPYFNKHENTRILLDVLLATKEWNAETLAKKKIFKKVFPTSAYQEQHLSNLISYLLKLVRKFYIQKQSEKSELDQQLNLMKMALDAEQDKLFLLTSGRVKKALEGSELLDNNYFFQQSQFQLLQDNYDLKYGKRSSGEYLQKSLKFFDTYFIGEKLKLTCQMLARKQVTGSDYAFPFIKELITFLEKEKQTIAEVPSVRVYYLAYKMLTAPDADFYFQLKDSLKKQIGHFRLQEGRDIYTHALNYCIGRLNLGESTFRKEAFELYQQMLANGLLYVNAVLPHWDFTNIVSLGCELQEYDWVEKFIWKEKEQLPQKQKENTFRFNLAYFYYSQKSYDEAIELLQKVEFSEVYYNLLTRILLLKIYFENRNVKALDYSLETFRIFLLRTKQLETNRQKSGLNLIRFTKKLSRIIEDKPLLTPKEYSKKLELFTAQIEKSQKVLNRSWLLQKVKDLDV